MINKPILQFLPGDGIRGVHRLRLGQIGKKVIPMVVFSEMGRTSVICILQEFHLQEMAIPLQATGVHVWQTQHSFACGSSGEQSSQLASF